MARSRQKIPSTPALRMLREQGLDPVLHPYRYVPRGGAQASSEALGWPLHAVVKTLVFEDDRGEPLVVLMHGDRQVSAKALARVLGVKAVTPCRPAVAERHTGYKVGGTSPFGTRRALPVYVEAGILELDRVLINAGARGVLMELEPRRLVELLEAVPVEVGR